MRWTFRVAAVLVVLAAVAVAALGLLGDDDGVDTVERVATEDELQLGAPPDSYRIEYDRELLTSGLVDREVVTGRLPFDLRVERPGDLQLATLGALELGAPDESRTALVASPAAPAGAPVVTGDIDELLRSGLMIDLGQAATVAGRPCRFVRVGGALDAVPLVEPTDDDHTDVCIDERSLVLHEEVTVAGRVTRQRTATDVLIDPIVDDDTFAPLGERLPESLGGGRVRRMTDDTRFPDVDFFELEDEHDADGFEHRGRFVVANDVEVDPQGVPGNRTVGLADVFVAGSRTVVVENVRSTAYGVAGLATDTGLPWDVAGHPQARLLLGLSVTELRTGSVRVSGNVPVADLVAIFEALVVRNGPAGSEPYDDVVDVLDEG